MRTIVAISLMALFAMTFLFGCASENDPVTAPTIQQGTLDAQPDVYFNDSLAYVDQAGDPMTANYYVYLPNGYSNSGNGYPVLFLLHGFGQDEFFWNQLFKAQNMLDELISTGAIDPMVVVMFSGENAFGGSFYHNGFHPFVGNAQRHIGWMIDEIIDNYNVVDDASQWGIAGHSMGGYGALHYVQDNPGAFASVAALAAPVAHNGTLPNDDTYTGIRELLPAALQETGYDQVLAETGGAGDPAQYQELMEPDPSRPITSMMFALAAAFSPFNPLDPYTPTLIADYGVNIPIAVNGSVDETTFDRWLQDDITTQILAGNPGGLATASIYLDCGLDDDLGLYGAHQVLAGVLDGAGFNIEVDTYYDGFPIVGEGEVPADHATMQWARLEPLLIWLDGNFNE
ncbi:hypothetical protein GF324_07170 [bacterium]|nr:hypothetical protein [bacterium]